MFSILATAPIVKKVTISETITHVSNQCSEDKIFFIELLLYLLEPSGSRRMVVGRLEFLGHTDRLLRNSVTKDRRDRDRLTCALCRNSRRYRWWGYQADRSLWTGAWVWENPDRTYHRASVAACLSCSKAVRKENQKRKSRKREGAGISACSFLTAWNVNERPDWRLNVKKKLVVVGMLATIAGVVAAFKSRKKYTKVRKNY